MFSLQQKVSYQAFLREQRIKLGSKYPFLSKPQINKKVKDLWDKLGTEEKHHYTKTTLSKTPPKSPRRTKKKHSSTVRGDNSQRWSCFDTPEQLFDETPSKNEGQGRDYTNCGFDSIESPIIAKSPRERRRRTADDWLYTSTTGQPHQDSSEESHHNVSPAQYNGILKSNSDLLTSAKKTKPHRVSFSREPADEREISEGTVISQDIEDRQGEFPTCFIDSSDEDDAMLISRSGTEVGVIQDADDRIENSEESVTWQSSKGRCDVLKNSGSSEKQSSGIKQTVSEKREDRVSPDVKDTTSQRPKRGRRANGKKGKEETNTLRKNGEGKVSVDNSKRNLESPFQNDDSNVNVESSIPKATPKVGTCHDFYETPMMVAETIQQSVAELSKAPRKRRSCTESADENRPLDSENTEKAKGRKSTSKKSKLSLKNLTANGDDSSVKDQTKNEKIKESPKSETKSTSARDKKDVESAPKGESKENDGCCVDASGDAKERRIRKSDHSEQSILDGKEVGSTKGRQQKGNQMLTRRRTRSQSGLVSRNGTDEEENNMQAATELPSSQEEDFNGNLMDNIVSSEGESPASTDILVTKSKANQALMKVLSMMKRTVVTPSSPSTLLSDKSDLLLSPALSGISTLSSLSSDTGEITVDLKLNNASCVTEEKEQISHHNNLLTKDDEIFHAQSVQQYKSKELGLCEMFQDITPPHKQEARKKSRRLLSSAANKGSSNFSTWFTEDKIFH